jgi:hypothetical protein
LTNEHENSVLELVCQGLTYPFVLAIEIFSGSLTNEHENSVLELVCQELTLDPDKRARELSSHARLSNIPESADTDGKTIHFRFHNGLKCVRSQFSRSFVKGPLKRSIASAKR